MTGTGSDRVQLVHTGAASAGAPQVGAELCLGGLWSGSRVVSALAERPQALPGVGIGWIAAGLQGVARLESDGAGRFRWAPSGGGFGPWVAIGAGEEGVLEGPEGGQHLVLWRTGGLTDPPRGVEVFGARPCFHGALGARDFEEAESTAGGVYYRCVVLRNAGESTLDSVLVWGQSIAGGAGRFAVESLVDGAVQEIADGETAPTGVTWQTAASQETAVEVGPLAAGAGVGIWVERSVGEGAEASALEGYGLAWYATATGVAIFGEAAGLNRVAAAGVAGLEVYAKLGSDPVPGVDEPVAVVEALPASVVEALDAAGVWHVDVRRRNRYGLLSGTRGVQRVVVDGEGAGVAQGPSGPELVRLSAGAGGVGVVSAVYYPGVDAAERRGTHWVVWFRADGEAIDPGVDEPAAVLAFGPSAGEAGGGFGASSLAPVRLGWVSDAQPEGAPLEALVRVRRVVMGLDEEEEPEVVAELDSDNTATVTAEAVTRGPGRPRGEVFLGRTWGVAQAAIGAPGEVVLEEEIEVVVDAQPGVTVLRVGEVEIWRAVWLGDGHAGNGVFVDGGAWTVVADGVSGAGVAGLVEVDGDWPAPSRFWICVGGVRRLLVDLDAGELVGTVWAGAGSLETGGAPGAGVWPRWGEVLFSVWDGVAGDWRAYAELQGDGDLRFVLPVVVG